LNSARRHTNAKQRLGQRRNTDANRVTSAQGCDESLAERMTDCDQR